MQPCQSQGCGGSGECSSSSGSGAAGGSKGGGSWGAAGGGPGRPHQRPNCLKCKKVPAVVRSAVKTQGLVQPGDRVLVPVSGGPASLALVYLLLQLRSTNAQRLERGKVVFELEVVHVDEGTAGGLPEGEAAALVEGVVASVKAAGHEADPCILPLQPSTSSADDADDALLQLGSSLSDISDITAREDAVKHLRRRRVQQYAQQVGCNKIAWGDCASSTAIQIMSDFAKGRGFSLAADIQVADARGGSQQPAGIYLLRGTSSKELAMVCRRHGMRFWSMPVLPQQARSSINQLAEAFMENLQAQVPHTIYTVTRTASHLKPFPFNALPSPPLPTTAALTSTPSASRQPATSTSAAQRALPPPGSSHSQEAAGGSTGLTHSEAAEGTQRWCRVCDAPLHPSAPAGTHASSTGKGAMAEMCYSCSNQFGKYLAGTAAEATCT